MFLENRKAVFASFALVLVSAIWGFAFVVVKDFLDYVGAVWMVAIRFSFAAVVLFLFCIPRLNKLNKKIVFHGLILGAFLYCAYLTQTIGCKYTTAGKNAFITTVYVVLVPLFSWPVLRKRPKWFVWLAAFLSICGIALLALGNEFDSVLKINFGDLLTLVCGIFYALHIVFGAKYVFNEDPVLLTLFQFTMAGALGFLTAPFIDGTFDVALFKNPHVIISFLYLGLLSTLLCFLLQNVALKYVPSALASLFMSLESVFGIFFSVIFLSERLTAKMLIGCVLIFFSILIAEVLPKMHKNTET